MRHRLVDHADRSSAVSVDRLTSPPRQQQPGERAAPAARRLGAVAQEAGIHLAVADRSAAHRHGPAPPRNCRPVAKRLMVTPGQGDVGRGWSRPRPTDAADQRQAVQGQVGQAAAVAGALDHGHGSRRWSAVVADIPWPGQHHAGRQAQLVDRDGRRPAAARARRPGPRRRRSPSGSSACWPPPTGCWPRSGRSPARWTTSAEPVGEATRLRSAGPAPSPAPATRPRRPASRIGSRVARCRSGRPRRYPGLVGRRRVQAAVRNLPYARAASCPCLVSSTCGLAARHRQVAGSLNRPSASTVPPAWKIVTIAPA
jgi:hypothetical protein